MYLVCRLLLAPATPSLYPLSLHDALPIWEREPGVDHHDRALCLVGGHVLADLAEAAERDDAADTHLQRSLVGAYADAGVRTLPRARQPRIDRKSTRLNSSHRCISYAVFCLPLPPPHSTLFPYTTLFRSGNASPASTTTIEPSAS